MGVYLPTVLPTVVPQNQLASYSRPTAAAAPATQLASGSAGSFVNQQLGGLRAGLTAGAGGATGSVATDPTNRFKLPATTVGVQLAKTTNNLKQGNANIQKIVAAGQAKRAQLAGASTGMYQGQAYGGPKYAGAIGKGQIATPDSRLTAVGHGQYLANNAAAALSQLNAAFHAATGGNISVTEGWRSLSTQQKYYALHQAGIMKQAVAAPGHSVHGTGNAADLGGIGGVSSATFNWLVKNASKYGWSWTGHNFGESWHWEYTGA
jgi:hypothetical protein